MPIQKMTPSASPRLVYRAGNGDRARHIARTLSGLTNHVFVVERNEENTYYHVCFQGNNFNADTRRAACLLAKGLAILSQE